MKPPVDVAFWLERAKQPDCMTFIQYNSGGLYIIPVDDTNHEKLYIQMKKRLERARRI